MQPSVHCYTPEWTQTVPIAVLGVVMYVFLLSGKQPPVFVSVLVSAFFSLIPAYFIGEYTAGYSPAFGVSLAITYVLVLTILLAAVFSKVPKR